MLITVFAVICKLLICKITQWPCSTCPIPQSRIVGVRTTTYIYIFLTLYFRCFLDTPGSGPRYKSLWGVLAAPCHKAPHKQWQLLLLSGTRIGGAAMGARNGWADLSLSLLGWGKQVRESCTLTWEKGGSVGRRCFSPKPRQPNPSLSPLMEKA